jgi:sugar lactone lactonase YvrE
MPAADRPHRAARSRAARASLLLLAILAACSDANDSSKLLSFAVSGLGPLAPAGSTVPIVVTVTDADGAARAGLAVDATAAGGGGSVAPAAGVTDEAGQVAFAWTIGLAPVSNTIRLDAERSTAFHSVLASVAEPYEPAPFGDVNAYLGELGITGSTEGLAFTPDGERLILGVPGGLIALDPAGNASAIPLSGDPIVNPLGIAFDRAGNLWVADSGGKALRVVSPDGEVTTRLTTSGDRPLAGPNYVAIGPDDRVYLSDPCLGELLRFDPARNVVDAVMTFDLPSEGGPNGFAFDASGERLWLATENTGLLCGHSFVGVTDPIAGLFAIDVGDAGFGARETVAANVALFGDGVAFDAESNLYVIFDTQQDFMLEESAIWVLPAGRDKLEKLAAVRGRVLANLAFGTPAFGEGTLYIALLAVPPFTPATARGAELLDVGIPGLSLLP